MRKLYLALGAVALLAVSALLGGGQGFRALAQNVACYMDQGGAGWHLGNGCTLTVESSGVLNVASGGALKIGGTSVSGTAAELNAIAGVTAGTAAANKAVVLDGSKGVSTITSATITTLTTTDIDAGASATAGSVDVFPTTASKGKLSVVAADSAGNTTTTITNASQAAARTYTIPDAGASASFAMTQGAQTIVGATTFTAGIVPTGGVAAAGGFSVSPRLFHTGGMPARVSTDGTDATPVVTEVYIAEVFVPANATITGVSVMNGSVASGNIKVGLANSSGAVVATSASTAMSGTDSYQRVSFTGTYAAVGPATYYVLESVDNNTARINTHIFGDFGAAKQTGQVYATGFTTITPPTTFTTGLAPIASLF